MSENQERSLQPAIYGLLVLGAVMGIVAVVQGVKMYSAEALDRQEHYPLVVWAGANALICISAAIWAFTYKPPTESREEVTTPTKLLILGVGGLLGFTTVLCLGVLYALFDKTWLTTATGSRAAWKEAKTWYPILLALAGLGVMLLSFVAVRSEERKNPTFRRLIYGFNSVLMGLLVLAILGVGNVFAAVYGNKTFDWTGSNIYSISEPTKRVLRSLDTPIRVYVLPRRFEPLLLNDVRTLLESCTKESSQLTFEEVTTVPAMRELISKYDLLDETVLLVVQDPDGEKPQHQALRLDDLEENLFGRVQSEASQRSFKGEQAILSAISKLRSGGVSGVVYFTQDSGEMRLSEFSRRRGVGIQEDRGVGALKSKLEKANYTVKEWNLASIDPETKQSAKIPDDAFAVVMAGPADLGDATSAAAKVKVLDDYMKRSSKSKLIVLLDVRRNREGEVQPTGLESFLSSFGVQVGKNILVHPPLNIAPEATAALVYVPNASDAAFQDAFRESGAFRLWDARTVQPATPPPAKYVVSALLETAPIIQRQFTGTWPEEKIRGNPDDFVMEMAEKNREEVTRKMQTPPVAVAVTVREKSGDSSMPDDPVHAPMRQKEGEPRLIVFGSSSLASNTLVEGGREIYYNLIQSCLAWFRGRPEMMTEITPKARSSYKLNLKAEDSSLRNIIWLPILVLIVGVVGAGVSVWFLRRQ
jgi:gliding motility-associatede transport system auxiliary component